LSVCVCVLSSKCSERHSTPFSGKVGGRSRRRTGGSHNTGVFLFFATLSPPRCLPFSGFFIATKHVVENVHRECRKIGGLFVAAHHFIKAHSYGRKMGSWNISIWKRVFQA
ncbi:unnamed protein product, partial [Pylaiella littoralis]